MIHISFPGLWCNLVNTGIALEFCECEGVYVYIHALIYMYIWIYIIYNRMINIMLKWSAEQATWLAISYTNKVPVHLVYSSESHFKSVLFSGPGGELFQGLTAVTDKNILISRLYLFRDQFIRFCCCASNILWFKSLFFLFLFLFFFPWYYLSDVFIDCNCNTTSRFWFAPLSLITN